MAQSFSLIDIDAGMEIAPPGYWKTKGGALIRIADMTDQHVINALLRWAKNIEMLGGSYERLVQQPKWKELQAEIDRRGVIGQVFPVGANARQEGLDTLFDRRNQMILNVGSGLYLCCGNANPTVTKDPDGCATLLCNRCGKIFITMDSRGRLVQDTRAARVPRRGRFENLEVDELEKK